MNFTHMPELNTVWGYPAVLLVIGVTCTGLYIRFKRRRWL